MNAINHIIEQAVSNARKNAESHRNCSIWYGKHTVELMHVGKITCNIEPVDGRFTAGGRRTQDSYRKSFRLNGKVISKAKLEQLLKEQA